MLGATSRGSHSVRRMTGAATAAAVAVGLVSLAPAAQGQDTPEPAAQSNARVFRDAGSPLSSKSDGTPAGRVRAYLKGRGLSDDTVSSLTADGGTWKNRGVTHLRMEQHVAGLRIPDAYARAAFDSKGRLIDVVEAVASVPKAAPRAASLNAGDALRAAVADLYPGRPVDARSTDTSGNTTTFTRDGWHVGPTVERVALPTAEGALAVGYVVTTWTESDNELVETVVDGKGKVVDTIRRTAEDGYNVFPEDPDHTPQTTVQGPGSGNAQSPLGWLVGAQFTRNISGNNAHAYLDSVADNAPDASGSPVTNGLFSAVADLAAQPDSGQNPDVAVQNLFYLNNAIHDTLYKAGFDEAAGNFQEDNFKKGGRGGDPVAAEAQDGGGTDNANFSTPRDGRDPRMQMYLWNAPITHEVVVGSSTYAATGAGWGAQLDSTGLTGTLAVADDQTGSFEDACEPLTGTYTGKLVIADRGTCAFTVKAKNAQDAGAAGLVVANNADTAPITMGGEDSTVTIPGVMVAKADGATLKGQAGSSATIRLVTPKPLMRDGDVDSDIVWHEYGHGLTWRMIGRMDGPIAGAIGEGMSDVLALIANEDDRVGEYSTHDSLGIRRYPYEGYPLTYAGMNQGEVHADGEVYGAIGWKLLQGYQAAGIDKSVLLADLVDGMNYTPAKPKYEDMRDGILAGLAASGNDSRSCMVWDAFADFGVGVGAKATVRGSRVTINESFARPSGC